MSIIKFLQRHNSYLMRNKGFLFSFICMCMSARLFVYMFTCVWVGVSTHICEYVRISS